MGLIIVLSLVSICGTVLWVWALVDSINRPDWVYQQASSSKVLWIVLVIILGSLGALIYLLAIRPRLVQVQMATGYVPVQVPVPATRFCGACGGPTGASDRHCGQCGAAVLPGPPPAPIIPRYSPIVLAPITASLGTEARIQRQDLLSRLVAHSAEDLDLGARRVVRIAFDNLLYVLGKREALDRVAVGVCQGHQGLLAVTSERLLFFDATSGVLEVEFGAAAPLWAGPGWLQIADERGGVEIIDLFPTTAGAVPRSRQSDHDTPQIRRCTDCDSEFTPQFQGSTCPDCGGTLVLST